MGEVIGEVLGLAVGVAISPLAIIAVILMLLSQRATINSIAFFVGWLLGLAVPGVIVLVTGLHSTNGGPSTTSGWVRVVIGVAFFVFAVRQWRRRPAPGEAPSTPAWIGAIDDFTAVRSLGLAVALSAVSPKNLGLTIAAAATIGAGGLSAGDEVIALVVYVVIATATVAAPLVCYLLLGERAEHALTEVKEWLVANNATVLTVLFTLLGAKILGDGISILA